MSEETWPAPTPRDEMFRRVVTRGRRIQMINRAIVAAAAAGLVTAGAIGVVLGTNGTVELFGAETSATVDPGGTLGYHACPGGDEVGRFRSGDRVYVTGRDATGEWVEVRSPAVTDTRVWVTASGVDTDRDVDLPERSCEVTELALEGPGIVTTTTVPEEEPPEEESPEEEPEETTTTAPPGPAPTTQPGPAPTTPTTQPSGPTPPPPTTQPTPTTTPTTQPPDTADPVISDLQRVRPQIRGSGSGEFCTATHTTTEVSALVSDASAVTVTLHWSFVGKNGPIVGQKSMTLSNGRWRATLGSFPNAQLMAGQSYNTNWSVRAVDAEGNDAVVLSGSNSAVELQGC